MYEATHLGAGQFVGLMCSRERTGMNEIDIYILVPTKGNLVWYKTNWPGLYVILLYGYNSMRALIGC